MSALVFSSSNLVLPSPFPNPYLPSKNCSIFIYLFPYLPMRISAHSLKQLTYSIIQACFSFGKWARVRLSFTMISARRLCG